MIVIVAVASGRVVYRRSRYRPVHIDIAADWFSFFPPSPLFEDRVNMFLVNKSEASGFLCMERIEGDIMLACEMTRSERRDSLSVVWLFKACVGSAIGSQMFTVRKFGASLWNHNAVLVQQ